MEEVVKGMGMGVGFVLGLILIVLVVFLISLLFWKLYALSMRRKFSAELFRLYSRELLQKERFEELHRVQEIIERLEQKQQAKEMLRDYEVAVHSDLEWIPMPDGGERLIFRRDRRIIKKIVE